MKIFVFGLPGAGKSTLVKASKMPQLRLDLGHNAFKSELERQKFYDKLSRFTTGMIQLQCDFIIDTYPEYFDIEAFKSISDFQIWFLLPNSASEAFELVQRVGDRDGFDSDFYKLYRSKWLVWWQSWNKTYQQWKAALGQRVIRKSIYTNEDNGITVTKEVDKHEA